ncbi:MAG: hypothetical protein FH749_00740 [Firmicutes bacterium]|nr:hypothetical protein [Bacillota bacterium]
MDRKKIYFLIGIALVLVALICAMIYWFAFHSPEIELIISEQELSIVQGESGQLQAALEPWYINRELIWSTSHPRLLTVDDQGNINALRTGSAVVYVSEPGGSFAACLVTVEPMTLTLSGGTYTGEVRDGRPHWQGEWIHPDGYRYSGQWVDGVIEGEGTMEWPDGQIYTGEWRAGKMHGYGIMEWPSGQRYQGQWLADQLHGAGSMTWPDGDHYEGQWRYDEMHGSGVMHWANGESYTGQWVSGKINGAGTYRWPDGEEQTGTWEDGKFKGE